MMNENEQAASRNRLQVEQFRAPHGPDQPYTDEEIRASLLRYGADRSDMMLQNPDRYFDVARAVRHEQLMAERRTSTAPHIGRRLLGYLRDYLR